MHYLEYADSCKDKNFSKKELILKFRGFLDKYIKDNFEQAYKPKSLLESRFTPSEVAFLVGMSSCGSMVNIITDMFRHVGYEVTKVHGSIPKSRDHAWIKVRENKQVPWEVFDPSQKDCLPDPDRKEIATCENWTEIANEIAEAHLGYS